VATYHRIESTSQPPEVAAKQQASNEIWGLPHRGGRSPSVKAYRGPLPDGARGIQFECEIEPDHTGHPTIAMWRGPREGVLVEDDFAKIRVDITKNTQT
jgi:hypothetical protein